jgi:hypothetical protein
VYVKKSLQELGFAEYWINQSVLSPSYFKNIVKSRIKDRYVQMWHEQVFNSSKCITYRIFKSSFELEPYFKLLPRNLALSLCRFRCSNHKLPIEKGRYIGMYHDLRYCHLCPNNSLLGDEFLYIFQCPYFNIYRRKYLPTNLRRGNMFNLQQLFQNTDRTVLIKLSVFTQRIMSIVK